MKKENGHQDTVGKRLYLVCYGFIASHRFILIKKESMCFFVFNYVSLTPNI